MSIASTSSPSTTATPTFHRRPRLRAVPDAVAHRHLGAPDPARDLPAVVRPDLVPTLSGDLVDYANLDHAASTPAFERVADAILEDARGQGQNDFKIPLARRAIVRALEQAAAGTPQSQTDKRIA